jgi:hypothetical protein
MNKELGFSPSIYGFGAGIFFFSYALCQVPASMMIARSSRSGISVSRTAGFQGLWVVPSGTARSLVLRCALDGHIGQADRTISIGQNVKVFWSFKNRLAYVIKSFLPGT